MREAAEERGARRPAMARHGGGGRRSMRQGHRWYGPAGVGRPEGTVWFFIYSNGFELTR
jgi:hypothetical protein